MMASFKFDFDVEDIDDDNDALAEIIHTSGPPVGSPERPQEIASTEILLSELVRLPTSASPR